MRRTDYKGKRITRKLEKSAALFKAFDDIQNALGTILDEDPSIVEIQCNVPLEDTSIGNYTSDFVCIKQDGSLMVRECVYRKVLLRPKTVKHLYD